MFMKGNNLFGTLSLFKGYKKIYLRSSRSKKKKKKGIPVLLQTSIDEETYIMLLYRFLHINSP